MCLFLSDDIVYFYDVIGGVVVGIFVVMMCSFLVLGVVVKEDSASWRRGVRILIIMFVLVCVYIVVFMCVNVGVYWMVLLL